MSRILLKNSSLAADASGSRVSHPHAKYVASSSSADQSQILKCILCALPIHGGDAVAWSGHIGSKKHRANLALQLEADRKEAERQAKKDKNKRRKIEADTDGSVPRDSEAEQNEDSSVQGQVVKDTSESALPAGFFDNQTDAAAYTQSQFDLAKETGARNEDADEEDDDEDYKALISYLEDDEQADDPEESKRAQEAYELINAKPHISVAPVAIAPEGFPEVSQKSTHDSSDPKSHQSKLHNETQVKEKSKKDEQIEKDLIEREERLEALEEETRAQEEADLRVLALKAKIERMKALRAARKG